MSSSPGEASTPSSVADQPPIKYKKRRLQGACDICRRKKVRCDSANMPGNRCSNCIAFDSECTHSSASVKRKLSQKKFSSSQPAAGHEHLLAEDSQSATSVRSLVADILSQDIPYEPPTDVGAAHRLLTDLATYARTLEDQIINLRSTVSQDQQTELSLMTMPASPESSKSSTAADEVVENLSDQMKRSLTIESAHKRFYGPSSNIMLVKIALKVKEETRESDEPPELDMGRYRRPQLWKPHLWEITPADPPPMYLFPEHELLLHLVDLYFANFNAYFPLLYRPMFERDITAGFHLRNHLFGATVLAVCAVGSRYSIDPQVLLEGTDSHHSCGWKWFRQIKLVRSNFRDLPSIYELQTCCLALLFLQGTSTPDPCWTILSLGIAYAQEAGIHMKKSSTEPSVEEELWKRAFWMLVCADTFVSGILGRPRMMNSSDYNVDMPIECDDEYWEHPDLAMRFKQPPGKPSYVTSFNTYLKLLDIFGFAQRTIYAAKKPHFGKDLVGEKWEQQVVATLDSALNKWVDSIPEHLRWDPHRIDPLFFNQSALLYSNYYYVQIQVHRNFLSTGARRSTLAFPSLSICSNAARACSHVMDIQSRRGFLPLPHTQTALFTAGLVLLITIWGGRKQGLAVDSTRGIADMYKIINVLQSYEGRWSAAGRFSDILCELMSASDLGLSSKSQASMKRNRDPEDYVFSRHLGSSSQEPLIFPLSDDQSGISADLKTSTELPKHPNYVFQLPFHSNELGQTSFMNAADVFAGQVTLNSENDPLRDLRAFSGAGMSDNRANQSTPYSSEVPHEGPVPSIPWTDTRRTDDHGNIHSGYSADFLEAFGMGEGETWRMTLPTGQNDSWSDWSAFIADVESFMQNNYST